jgi:thiamine kinase-like enzyme
MEKINEFHQATLEPIYVDHFIYSQWVGDRLNLLATAVQNLPGSKALLESIKHLKDDLQDKLIGKQFDSSWIHGDYVPGNILATKDGSEITGIIDWELAHPIELPGLDMAQFIMAAGIYTQGMEMGQIVINILKDQDMGSEIRAGLYAIEKYLPASTPDIKTLVVLAWLRHVSTNMIKSETYMSHLYWVMENIESVLKKIW